MFRILIACCMFVALSANAQKKPAYLIYNSQGKKVTYKKMLKDLNKSDMLFFGEEHDNAIAHWLELELTMALNQSKNNKVILGFEMFETDEQMKLNDYLANLIKERTFIDSCRWSNYKTDYHPIVQYAKNNSLQCVATNIPRKYASLVYKQGKQALNQLSADELTLMCPKDFIIDTTLSQYRELAQMGIHGGGDFVTAQAIKDATMAQFIHTNWQEGSYFIHFNGSFHSDFHQGIVWYLQQYRPTLNCRTISVVSQDVIDKLDKESLNRADYVICVPTTMTKTH